MAVLSGIIFYFVAILSAFLIGRLAKKFRKNWFKWGVLGLCFYFLSMFIIFMPIYFVGVEKFGADFISSINRNYWRFIVTLLGVLGVMVIYLTLLSRWSRKTLHDVDVSDFGKEEKISNTED